MFALDWDDFGEDDDHVPFEERGWVKRMREREAARKRFDEQCPDFFFRMGQAAAAVREELAIRILMGEENG